MRHMPARGHTPHEKGDKMAEKSIYETISFIEFLEMKHETDEYKNLIKEKATEIVENRDIEQLKDVLEEYDKLARTSFDILAMPEVPFWVMYEKVRRECKLPSWAKGIAEYGRENKSN